MKAKRFGAMSSSENPEELAGRIKAAILALSAIIIWVGSSVFGITLNPEDVVEMATQGSAVIAAVWFAYSTCKAGLVWIYDKWNNV